MSEWLGASEERRPPATAPKSRDLTAITDTELRILADGCTEHTCPRHGEFNRALAARGASRHIEQGNF